ncbi:MAG: UTP--glucose-1-phosphate uridylyltransferase GalU [Magnetococcales bacterium]|nr:UTP--glucose-1-phosphate uridylyltransferase GalU [Magnetococcales bacterium]NGZ27644.1 UTP--glucose-1-phosphate uridylyltransferase GalU [Magnetococcales bacterium]
MKIRKVIVPVGGLGTRFLPATKAIPKEMLPVVDRPLIQYAVEEAWAAGAEHVIFVTSRGKKSIEDHFDHFPELEELLSLRGKVDMLQSATDMIPEAGRIHYTRQSHPLGLGHAIWCARELVGDEPFAIILPDDLIHARKPVLQQMTEGFQKVRAPMIAVMEVEQQETSKYGIVAVEEEKNALMRVRSMVEKPAPQEAPSRLAIIGRYILTPEIFDILGDQEEGRQGEIQLTDAMAGLLKRQVIYAYRFQGTRYDCGDNAGYLMANLALAMERPALAERLIPFLKKFPLNGESSSS